MPQDKVHSIDDEIHEVYKDDEVITVKLTVRDFKTLRNMIQREKSMTLVWKYVLSISGALVTIVAGIQALKFFGGDSG